MFPYTDVAYTYHPDRQRCICRIFTGLEEPKEGIDLVRLILHAEISKSTRRQADITRVALDSIRGLAQVILHLHQ